MPERRGRAVIVDYGSGNLRSVEKAFRRAAEAVGFGDDISVTDRPDAIAAASHIALPGVGAFGDCRHGLDALPGMVAALQEAVVRKARPFLGICVGMQLMADRGLEHGRHAGLGWIPGEVVALTPDDANLKIPHMGWNDLTVMRPDHPVFRGIAGGTHMYFVHGFRFACADAGDAVAEVDYGGPTTAAVARDAMVGTQFHPEKSQAAGLRLIANFLQWRP